MPAKASIRLTGHRIQRARTPSASSSPGAPPPSRRGQQPDPIGQNLPGDDRRRSEDADEQRLAHLAGLEVDARANDASGGQRTGTALQDVNDRRKKGGVPGTAHA